MRGSAGQSDLPPPVARLTPSLPSRDAAAPARRGAPAEEAGLLALLVASGATGLAYELVWVRWFAALFGATAWAASAVFAAYFLGLALGSRWMGACTQRIRRPLRAYAALEAAALAGALLVPVWLRAWEPLYAVLYGEVGGPRWALVACKLALAFATLLPPCVALGGTLPVAARAFALRLGPRAASRRANLAYGLNTLGGALGVGLAGFVLPERVGISGTYLAAACLQGAVVLAALALARRAGIAPAPAPASDASAPAPSLPTREAGAAAAAGAGALAVQVVLLRALDQVLVSSLFNTALVLGATLVAIGVAGLTASWRRGVERVEPAAIALAAGVGLALFPALFVGALAPASFGSSPAAQWAGVAAAARVAAALGLPLLVLASLLLPWIVARPAPGVRDVAGRVGRLLAWNIAGSVAGSLVTGFALLGALGLWGTATLVAGGYLAIGAVALGRRRPAAGAAVVVLGALVLAGARPWAQTRVWLGPGERLVHERDGAHASVAVIDDASGRVLRLDNHYVLAGTGLAAHEERRGHLPLLLHPAPRAVAVLGSATGLTAGAALVHPEVQSLDVVEIVPEVAEAARRYFRRWNRGVYEAPVTRVLVEDARNHVRATSRRYDVVIGELVIPWNPGASGLFAREHFEAVRARLRPGGLYCHWLPLHQLGREIFETVAASFRDVFPEVTLWRGSFRADTPTAALCSALHVGSDGELRRRMAALASAGVRDRWVLHPAGVRALFVATLEAAPLDGAPRNSDDRPRVELRSYREAASPLVGRAWAQWTESLGAAGPGEVLYAYELARLEGREADVHRIAARARRLLPPELLAPARGGPAATSGASAPRAR